MEACAYNSYTAQTGEPIRSLVRAMDQFSEAQVELVGDELQLCVHYVC